jgi:hypothetical protein
MNSATIHVLCEVLMTLAGMSIADQRQYVDGLRDEASRFGDDLMLALFESGDLEWLVVERQSRGSYLSGRA